VSIGDEGLTASAILAQITELNAPVDPQSESRRDGYRQAAAVLASVGDPGALRPFDLGQHVEHPQTLLDADLVPASGSVLEGAVVLRHDVRRGALRELGSRERMLHALEANPGERKGAVQEQLERYLRGTATPIEEQSLEELQASLQALTWLDGILDGLPDLDAVRHAITRQEFRRPFEAIAGDANFRGRVREMDTLRDYVGVLPPQGLLKRVLSKVPWPRPAAMPALSIYGPGGVGKSALIARFVLEHSRLKEDARIPFAYLDFDRPALSMAEPTTLLEEMLEQLTMQFPEHADFVKIRAFLSEQVAKLAATPSDAEHPEEIGQIALVRATLADLLGVLEHHLGPRPYLVVLDTFERVQYRGEAVAYPLWKLLSELQEARPFLRVVVAGRAPVTTLRLAGKPARALELGELDTVSAIAFLHAQGITRPDIARSLVKQVGGLPLSLKLAATVIKRSPETDLHVRSRGWLGTAVEIVQGQLFDRILEQIEREDVRRMAHPGLVLRRVTPELILEVLREPCDLPVNDIAGARELFEALRREVSLVADDTEDEEGALVHRRELREVMLKLLLEKEPAKAEDIGRRAVAWYERHPSKRARAEESYHRLLLGEAVDKDVVSDPEVRSSIQASITELPVASQRLLATYGYQIDAEILEQASVEERDDALAAHVEELLPHRSAHTDARGALESRGAIDGDSPIWRARARLALEAGEVSEATGELEQGLIAAATARNAFRTFQLLGQKAWTCEVGGSWAELQETLPLLREYAERHGSVPGKLQEWMQRRRLERRLDTASLTLGDLAAVGRLLAQIRPRDFFAVFAATRGFWLASAAVTQPDPPVLDFKAIAGLILHEESPFAATAFDDDQARAALRSLLSASYSAASGKLDPAERDRLARALETMVGAWPYRNLYVRPPELRRQVLS
jgi:hypothetical protein